MKLNRRDFLKVSSATAVGLASTTLGSASDEKAGAKSVEIPTYCEICFWNCGAVARVEDGRVVKLDGHPTNPRSMGRLCARGNAGIGQLYDPERIKTPLINTGARGEGKFKQASWDDALGHIAEKMLKIKEQHGPESVAVMLHGAITSHMMHLLKVWGSPNFAFPSTGQCRGARVTAFDLTFGEDIGSPERVDLARSKVIALFGSHLGENMHNSQVQAFSDAIGGDAKIIVVDPRFSTAAGKATYWLPIKPATDMALILAWINVIIYENLYDRAYVDRFTVGFDALKQAVAPYTPHWAEAECEIPASTIAETARELGRYAPNVVVHPGRFTAWDGNDAQRVRAIAILNAILGTWGREGGMFLKTKASLPSLPMPAGPGSQRPPVTNGPHKFAEHGLTLPLRYATITGKPYPIKGWIVAGTNLLKSVPNQEKTMEAIKALDLLVAIDVMPYDTAMLADVVLPESTYLERHDALQINKGRSLSVAIRQPVVEPMYDSKPGWWIAKELANKLGLGQAFPWQTYEDRIKAECAHMGIDYEKLKTEGIIHIPDTAAPYISPLNQPKFHTPSGKIELYSKQLRDEGFDPIPVYKPNRQPEEGWFRLIFGRSPVHTFSRTTDNQKLFELMPENRLWLNASVAASMGIADADELIIENEDGVRSNPIKARVTERIRRDCVYMVHGFGATREELKQAYRKGADDQRLITRFVVDPISGSSGMRINFVKLEKV